MTLNQTTNRLKWCYYGILALAVITVVLCMKFLTFHISPTEQNGIIVSYIVICYMLISVAGGLWWFKRKITPLKKREDELRYNEYFRYALVRLCVIGAGLIIGIVAFYLMQHLPMIYCAAISAVALVFCKPQEARIELDLINDQDDQQL